MNCHQCTQCDGSHTAMRGVSAFLPVGQCRTVVSVQGPGRGSSQRVYFLTFGLTSSDGFEMTKYLQMGEINLAFCYLCW